MIIQNKRIVASILFVLISVVSIAQGPPIPGPPPPPALPIDGGVLFGLAYGLFYGAVKLFKQKKAN